jgi:hypothetical protein
MWWSSRREHDPRHVLVVLPDVAVLSPVARRLVARIERRQRGSGLLRTTQDRRTVAVNTLRAMVEAATDVELARSDIGDLGAVVTALERPRVRAEVHRMLREEPRWTHRHPRFRI